MDGTLVSAGETAVQTGRLASLVSLGAVTRLLRHLSELVYQRLPSLPEAD